MQTTNEAAAGERWIAVEFFGSGDPFFGGQADDRTLCTSGSFERVTLGSGKTRATFASESEAMAAAERATRRAGGKVSVSVWAVRS